MKAVAYLLGLRSAKSCGSGIRFASISAYHLDFGVFSHLGSRRLGTAVWERSIMVRVVKSTRIVPNVRPRRNDQSSIPRQETCGVACGARADAAKSGRGGCVNPDTVVAIVYPASPLVASPMACTASKSRVVTCAHGCTKAGSRSVKIFRAQSRLRQKNLPTKR